MNMEKRQKKEEIVNEKKKKKNGKCKEVDLTMPKQIYHQQNKCSNYNSTWKLVISFIHLFVCSFVRSMARWSVRFSLRNVNKYIHISCGVKQLNRTIKEN